MANILNTGTVVATSNPQANIEQVANTTQTATNTVSPITIPIQIQPQLATDTQQATNNNNLENLQTDATQGINSAPTPQAYNTNKNNTSVVDFNQIYSSYQSTFGTNTANKINTSNTTRQWNKKD